MRRSTPITLLNPDPILKNAISSIKRAQPRNSAVDPGLGHRDACLLGALRKCRCRCASVLKLVLSERLTTPIARRPFAH